MRLAESFCNVFCAALSLVLAIWSALKICREPGNRRLEHFFLTTIFVLLFGLFTNAFNLWLGRHFTLRLDLYAYRFDSLFGQPSYYLGRMIQRHPTLDYSARLAYSTMFPAILLILAAYYFRCSIEEADQAARMFVCTLLAVPLYFVIPISGPIYAFSHFPDELPMPLSQHAISLTAPPNGLPSLHTAAALLILYFSRRWKNGFLLASIYASLVIIATMGIGEHYFLDVLAAIPFTALIIWLESYPKIAMASQEAKAKLASVSR